MNHSLNSKLTLSRRRFLKITAIQSVGYLTLTPNGLKALIDGAPRPVYWNGILFGNRITFQVVHRDAHRAQQIIADCFSRIKRLESLFTLYEENSCLRRLNQCGFLDDAPNEFCELIAIALRLSARTRGLFDITVKPLQDFFYRQAMEAQKNGNAENPVDYSNRKRFKEVLDLVDYRSVEVFEKRVRFSRSGMQMTLNGIAQGFLTDVAVAHLKSQGIEQALVDLGENHAIGHHPDNRPWRVGIRGPRLTGNPLPYLELENQALACSGAYGLSYCDSGRIHHLVNPVSGRCMNHFESVAVVAPTALLADALSTALSVVQPDQMGPILNEFPEIQAFGYMPDGSFRQLSKVNPEN